MISALHMFQEFFKPVVTPFEMELACLRYEKRKIANPLLSAVHSTIILFSLGKSSLLFFFPRTREWTGDYITDFRELLPGGYKYNL